MASHWGGSLGEAFCRRPVVDSWTETRLPGTKTQVSAIQRYGLRSRVRRFESSRGHTPPTSMMSLLIRRDGVLRDAFRVSGAVILRHVSRASVDTLWTGHKRKKGRGLRNHSEPPPNVVHWYVICITSDDRPCGRSIRRPSRSTPARRCAAALRRCVRPTEPPA